MAVDSISVPQLAAGSAGTGRPVAVSVENVSKVYSARGWLRRKSLGGGQAALRDVSFTVREGEMVGLLGPNGAGKTSLLKSIATLLRVSSGRILVQGCNVDANPIAARRLMGLVTCDERSFYWRLSGRQNLRFFAALYGVEERTAEARIAELLERLGLAAAADAPYQSYSTGMRQKLAVGRGLLSSPRLVLYDEPTRSLDPLSAQNIRQWIRESRKASPTTTHLIATNQLHEAEQLCDRVLILNQGMLIAEGTTTEIRQRVQSRGRLVHRIVCAGLARGYEPAAAPDRGIFEACSEEEDDRR